MFNISWLYNMSAIVRLFNTEIYLWHQVRTKHQYKIWADLKY